MIANHQHSAVTLVTRTSTVTACWTVVGVGIILMGCLLLLDLKSFENLPMTLSTSEMQRNASTSHSSHSSLIEECFHNNVNVSVSVSVNHSAATASIFEIPEDIMSQRDFQFCSQRENNVVLQRDYLRKNFASFEIQRPYSVTKNTMTKFHQHDGTHRRTCHSLKDMVSAVQFGSRRWEDPELELNATSLEKERHPSYFVPDHCDLPPMSSFHMCDTLSRYQHVINMGDSLNRHLHQGLFIGLRHDYISGGIQTTHLPTYEQCKCDGQFSEHSVCRKNDGLFYKMESSRQLGICSQQPPFSMLLSEGQYLDDGIPWHEIDCNSSDYRGLLLVLGGGVHFGLNLTSVMTATKHIFEHAQLQDCVDRGKSHVIWTGFGAQSRSLDPKYPHQSREAAEVFNHGMSEYLSSLTMNVTELHFWNLTKDAQTSDGMHFLSDVNIMKAFLLLQVAHLLKENGTMTIIS
jgi:hypothetical protein